MVADPATSEPWDAMQATEATLRGLLHMVGVAARNGNRLGAEHHTSTRTYGVRLGLTPTPVLNCR